MTAFVFAIQRVGGLLPSSQASDWTYSKAVTAHRAC